MADNYHINEVLKKKSSKAIESWTKSAEEYMDVLTGFMNAGFTREEAMQFTTIVASVYMNAMTERMELKDVDIAD